MYYLIQLLSLVLSIECFVCQSVKGEFDAKHWISEDSRDVPVDCRQSTKPENVKEELSVPEQSLKELCWVVMTNRGEVNVIGFEEVTKILNTNQKKMTTDHNKHHPHHRDRQSRKVFGIDTRSQSDPSKYPYNAIGDLDNGCTATFISPNHAITSGHCVYNHTTEEWQHNLNIRREKKNCNSNSGIYHVWKKVITIWGWYHNSDSHYDYAMIIYDTQSPWWMRITFLTTDELMESHNVAISGYPKDKKKVCLYTSKCTTQNSIYTGIKYYCDSAPGMSGSPVYMNINSEYWICGVHSSGSDANYAIHFNKCRYDNLISWIKYFK